MKIIVASSPRDERIYVKSFGYEDVSERAKWGRGVRNSYIIHYVLSGRGYFNGTSVSTGEGFLITPGMSHEYHSSKEEPWTYFWVIFDGIEAEDICQKYISCNKDGIFACNFIPRLLNLRNSIMAEETSIDGVRALGFLFLLFSLHTDNSEIDKNPHVREAKKYIKTNFCKNVSITEISGAIGVDDRYLYNLFMKHEGISPKQYLTSLKLNYAKDLLRVSDLTMGEIALAIGFSDGLTFSRFFSKKEGISPTEYRKNNS